MSLSVESVDKNTKDHVEIVSTEEFTISEININLSYSQKMNLLLNYNSTLLTADNHIIQFLHTQNHNYLVRAIKDYETLLNCVEITDYLLIGSENKYIPKYIYVESYYKLGTFYKTLAEKLINDKRKVGPYKLQQNEESLFKRAIFCFITVRRVDYEHELSLVQLMSIYSQLCFHVQHDIPKALSYLNEAMVFSPENTNINYNLGFLYQKMNRLELSLTHYKLSIYTNKFTSSEKERVANYINCYNGIASIYRSIKQWPESLFYLLKAHDYHKTEPNINNQLGVVYTEMRRTDLAVLHYQKAIDHVKDSIINPDTTFLLSEVYLNMGHMYSYNGDNEEAIECYNKALHISPKFTLPFQNKIFNLCYLYHQLEDKSYITKQHNKINTLFKCTDTYDFGHLKSKMNGKINVGIISGDFIDHPVSFFINTFLTKYNTDLFNVYCYSECIIDTTVLNKNLLFKFIKHKSTKEVSDLIYNDNIHILFDLAGHTAFNRMDVFANRPAPIQISYIGYPYTTGIKNMDYRITDAICDHPQISQESYTEKLIFFPNSFLCYNPFNQSSSRKGKPHEIPLLSQVQPFIKNGYITFGCFNRLNKINDSVIKLFNRILLEYNNCKFIFKTKAIINPVIQHKFLQKFDPSVHSRIVLMDCTILHDQHLLEYNKIDIAIDTFPYSGTTTSCESLYMGVPVFTMYDNVTYYHPQNVTASILTNSNLNEYIFNNPDELITKIKGLLEKPTNFWTILKQHVRNSFLSGHVCNQDNYMKNMQNLLVDLHKNHTF
jgi:predicted O-linked N-acetylglucosamine transferase (SPINDLY family)